MGETSKQSTSSFVFRDNSFDVLRIFSALLIVLGHIIGHLNCNVWKPLYLLWIHWPGLLCLFTLTGYLIPASLERSKSKKEFLVKRISRIYPELWVAFAVSLVAVLAMGGYGNLHYSVKDIVVWTISQVTVFQFYTPSSIEIYGVGNPNGALWTISMELQVYVVIMLVYPWLKKQKKSVWWGIGLISLLFNILYPFSEAFIPTIVYKLINVTFLPYAYIYWIGIYAYTFKDKLIPKLKKYFWYLLGGYMIWCVLNDTVLHLSFGHYCNIVSGVFICMLTLSAGYYFGNHKFKKDYSYSIYLYHMIVINVLVMFGIKGNMWAIFITYATTLAFSFISTNYVTKGNKLIRKLLLR